MVTCPRLWPASHPLHEGFVTVAPQRDRTATRPADLGGGAMLAMAHDYRVMRDDRGITAMSTGHRYPGAEAKEAGLVDDTAAESDLTSTSFSVTLR